MIELAHSRGYAADRDALTQDEKYHVDMLEMAIRHERVTPNKKPHKVERTKIDLWSYYVNDDIRLIVFKWKPSEWILVACGHHDPVYRKVERLNLKHIEGERVPAIVVEEIKETIHVVRNVVESKPSPQPEPGFRGISDEDFVELGIPKDCIPSLLSMQSTNQLLSFLDESSSFSQDTRDRLMDLYADPSRLDEMKKECRRQQERIPLERALRDSPTANEQIAILSDDLLEKYYSGQLDNWQIFLHPSQRRAVEMESNGPAMVTGAAGTGKTVVAVHRLNWLLQNPRALPPDKKVLFLTYTATLAESSKSLLEAICSSGFNRVHVTHLDDFIRSLWENMPGEKTIYYRDEPPREIQSVISQTYSGRRDAKFLYSEFLDVVLENRISSEADYVAFQRPASRPRVLRDERPELWKVFEQMKRVIPHLSEQPKVHVLNQLAAMYGSGRKDLPREYASIVVDEVQDFGASEFRFFAAYTGNSVEHPVPYSLFLAGDGHQRIYGRSGSFKKCGIDVKNRSIKLTKCYRSTKKIREYAEMLIAGVRVDDPNGEVESFRNSESLVEGTSPEEYFKCYRDLDSMNRHIVATIRRWMSEDSKKPGDYAVLLRNARGRRPDLRGNDDYMLTRTENELSELGLPCEAITRDSGTMSSDLVKIMTMHRAKGLQFQGVAIILNGWPYKPTERGKDGRQHVTEDQDLLQASEDQEKCLLYMAIMRAVSKVLLTGTGRRPKELPPKF